MPTEITPGLPDCLLPGRMKDEGTAAIEGTHDVHALILGRTQTGIAAV